MQYRGVPATPSHGIISITIITILILIILTIVTLGFVAVLTFVVLVLICQLFVSSVYSYSRKGSSTM